MDESAPFEHTLLQQAHKLVTVSGQNRRILLEPKREALPYHLKQALKKSTINPADAAGYLEHILESEAAAEAVREAGSSAVSEGGRGQSAGDRSKKKKDLFEESHRRFLKSATKLCTNSTTVNESLFFVISTYDNKSQDDGQFTDRSSPTR